MLETAMSMNPRELGFQSAINASSELVASGFIVEVQQVIGLVSLILVLLGLK